MKNVFNKMVQLVVRPHPHSSHIQIEQKVITVHPLAENDNPDAKLHTESTCFQRVNSKASLLFRVTSTTNANYTKQRTI